jgi:phage-related protein (TIGR01555 family)
MARKKPVSTKALTNDSLTNFSAALGIGANNQISKGDYHLNPITRTRTRLEYMYRGSWICGAAVDMPSEDMCRAGISINSDLSPEQTEELQSSISSLSIWTKLAECLKWSRLYGGCLGYLLVDGQDPSTPLVLDSVDIGQFRGIMPLDRWMVNPTMSDIITELGPEFGRPKYYEIVADRTGWAGSWTRVHHSRILHFTGIELPFQQKLTENGWGESVLERIYDRLVAFDSVSTGAAQLAFKAHLRVMKVDGLRSIIAAGGPAMDGLVAQIAHMRQMQANEGIAVIDTTDSLDTLSYSFGGMGDLMLQFGQQIAGALQIPLVRLFGQAPAGLNATGDSDLKTYYDNLAKQQENKLREPLVKVLELLSRSVLGTELPKGYRFSFNPLWLPEESDTADIAVKLTGVVLEAFKAGLITADEARDELKQIKHKTGVFNNL